MLPKTRSESVLFILALIMPMIYFATLPWNIDNASLNLMDHYFGADCWRVLEGFRDSDIFGRHNYRDGVHPFFPLFATSIAKLGSFGNVDGAQFLVYRFVFGTLGFFFFWLLLFREINAVTAFSATLLLMSTMAIKVWSILPETFLFGFFSLMLSLNLIRIKAEPLSVIVISYSGTVTNVFLGMAYLFRQFTPRKEFLSKIFVIALTLAGVSLLQRLVYPASVLFLDIPGLQYERTFLSDISTIPFRVFDFFYSGFAIPLPKTVSGVINSHDLWIEFLLNPTGGYTKRVTIGIVITLLTVTVLVVFSVFTFFKAAKRNELSIITLAFICFQLVLHMFYGDTPFLYSLHFRRPPEFE